jgi:hypothetical protein
MPKDTGITKTEGAMVITGDGIQFAQLLAIRGRLKMEIAGMTSRVNTLQAVNRMFGQNFRTRKQALPFIEEKVAEWKRDHS